MDASRAGGRMRAIVYREYGGPEVLQLTEMSRPRPGPGQVVVEVAASSINAADLRFMRAKPFLVRLFNGLRRPVKRRVLGQDVAGVVSETGHGVTRFTKGDRVFGEVPMNCNGAFAEACVASEATLSKVPNGVRLEDAAAVPLAGTTALQALRAAGVTTGMRVLLAGAGGGVGLFTVQLAKHMGAHVTASCGPRSVELMKSLGADEVLDYTRTPSLGQLNGTFEAIVAINGYQSLSTYRRLLVRGGRYVMVGGTNAQLFQALLLAKPFFAMAGCSGSALTIDPRRQASDLEQLGAFVAEGTVKVVVDRTFPLESLREAMVYAERGHVVGKIVISNDGALNA